MYSVVFQQVTARKFARVIKQACEHSERVKAMLGRYTVDEYSLMRCFLTSDGGAGFAIKSDGDLVNVFNLTGIKGFGSILVNAAIELGAQKLDCFDGFLPEFYAGFGFREVSREKNWTEGQPDVVYMRYAPEPKFLVIAVNGQEIKIPAA